MPRLRPPVVAKGATKLGEEQMDLRAKAEKSKAAEETEIAPAHGEPPWLFSWIYGIRGRCDLVKNGCELNAEVCLKDAKLRLHERYCVSDPSSLVRNCDKSKSQRQGGNKKRKEKEHGLSTMCIQVEREHRVGT